MGPYYSYKQNRTRWEGERLKALKLSQSTFDSAIKDDSTVAKKYMDYKKAVGGMLAHVNKITERISTVKELDQYLWMAVNTRLGELK